MARSTDIQLRDLMCSNAPTFLPFIAQPILSGANQVPFAFEILYRGKHPETDQGWCDVDMSMLRYLANHTVNVPLFVNLGNETILNVDEELLFAAHKKNNLFFEWSEVIAEESKFKALTAKINHWSRQGLRFVIDDFGAGRDGFERLFSVEFIYAIKFDRIFFRTIGKNSFAQKIAIHLIKECARQGILTVCEGIETFDEMRLAQGMGMDLMQGWYIDEIYDREPVAMTA